MRLKFCNRFGDLGAASEKLHTLGAELNWKLPSTHTVGEGLDCNFGRVELVKNSLRTEVLDLLHIFALVVGVLRPLLDGRAIHLETILDTFENMARAN